MAPQHRRTLKTRLNILKNDDLSTILEPAKPAAHIAGTKALVTLGPASREVDTLVQLLEAGMSCARVDLTYGSVEYHKQSLRNLQIAVRKTRRLCAVILDTFGRELVIRRKYSVDEKGWPKPIGSIQIKQGQEVIVTTDPNAVAAEGSNVLPVMFPAFDKMCQAGDTLFIGRYLVNGADQSSLYLDVVEVRAGEVVCKAENDAVLDGLLTVIHSERESDGMSNAQTELPLLTQHDLDSIKSFVSEFEIDFVALTYTCHGDDILELRDYLDSIGQDGMKIIAKVENRQALSNFESIAREADAVLLSRGNLGLDVLPEKMAIVQKAAISRLNALGKPAIITRVVDTMAASPRCTRAEATDVANAVLDGVDGVMLGAETLRGNFPVETVAMVLSICRQAEQVFNHKHHFDFLMAEAMEEADGGSLGGDSNHSSPRGSSQMLYLDSAEDGPPTRAPQAGTSLSAGNGSKGASGLPPKPPGSQSSSQAANIAGSPDHGTTKGMGPKASSFGSIPRPHSSGSLAGRTGGGTPRSPTQTFGDYRNLSKAESMASTAVRAADKIQAKLIVVYASTGRTASLVAKYRPAMPILTLVVPNLRATALRWQMEGRSLARQLLCMRGVIPMLAAPNIEGSSEGMLNEAVTVATSKGLIGPADHVVCLLSVKGSLVLKIVSVDSLGGGMARNSKGSHQDLAALSAGGSGGQSRSLGANGSSGDTAQAPETLAVPKIKITPPSPVSAGPKPALTKS